MLVHVLIGPPGSGKSTYAAEVIARAIDPSYPSGRVVHVSADHFFMIAPETDGAPVYRFDPAKLGEAHGACLRAFTEALAAPRAPGDLPLTVIVDNTNTTALEIAPYYAVAKAYGADVVLVHFDTHVATCIARNVHGVPPAEICRAWERARDLEPAVTGRASPSQPTRSAETGASFPAYWDVTETVRQDVVSYTAYASFNDPDCARTIAKVLSSASAYECSFPDGTVKMLSWVELHVGLKTSAPDLYPLVRYRWVDPHARQPPSSRPSTPEAPEA